METTQRGLTIEAVRIGPPELAQRVPAELKRSGLSASTWVTTLSVQSMASGPSSRYIITELMANGQQAARAQESLMRASMQTKPRHHGVVPAVRFARAGRFR
jgi:hypothetical protein